MRAMNSRSNWRRLFRKFVRYGVVGGVINLGGYLLFLLLTRAGLDSKVSMTLVYAAGAIGGFWGNRNWTFGHRGGIARPAIKYFGVHALGYLLDYAMLAIFVDRIKYPYWLVQAVAMVVVAGMLFVLFNFLVFPRPASAARSSP